MSGMSLGILKFITFQIQAEEWGNPCGFPHLIHLYDLRQRLTLGELEAGTSSFSAVLFTFFYA